MQPRCSTCKIVLVLVLVLVIADRSGRESLRSLRVDLSRFTTAGFGTVHGAEADGLSTGQLVAVTDDEADSLEAEVLAVRSGAADLRARCNRRASQRGTG
jgi:hypothetical protein